MILFIRFILVSIIIYLLVRSFVRFFAEDGSHKNIDQDRFNDPKSKNKGVSKEVGEFVDYEEVD